MNKLISILLGLLIFTSFSKLFAQNTLGTITYSEGTYEGYTLFTSMTETYLINNCGEVINQWTSSFNPGNAVYLLEDGSLLRACKTEDTSINFGGTGGRIEKYNWEGVLTWSFNYSAENYRQHHDIYPMPNGNVLMLTVDVLTEETAIQLGRNPEEIIDGEIYNEMIIELEPTGINSANIVWEWSFKDHLIQDFDATKENYGVVSENPQLLDFNFLGNLSGINNWLHVNSIQYNENFDQIVLSSRHLNEIYIIDHSTTTAEASSHLGGNSNKGGDFLYRWGNPQSYNQGTAEDQILFGQHYPHWIDEGLTDQGKLILFNNGFGRSPSYSEIFVIDTPVDENGNYTYEPDSAYGPVDPFHTYTNPSDPVNFFSRILSSAQRLPNGNTLICDGDSGYFFEINENHETVWEYINPSSSNGILTEGDDPHEFPNMVFRAVKYSPDYAAFENINLTPGNPIELDFESVDCSQLSIPDHSVSDVVIYPNPTSNVINISAISTIDKIELFNSLGQRLLVTNSTQQISISKFKPGFYFIKVYASNGSKTFKVIKE
ncbi:MAG: hypothetical protein BM564_10275 [Bacteroidetes bacterium MedPE-SWsnd-G2]|nr:MAG: hypothetical protein BM564_10275 [Bacteroidetes bacterium MedPE-SWsnd-G2]